MNGWLLDQLAVLASDTLVEWVTNADLTPQARVAAYGLLQSLLNDRDLDATLASAATALRRGGLLGIDLVPDLPVWEEYTGKIPIRGKFAAGTTVTLIESVRQDRRRGLTIFDERSCWRIASPYSCAANSFSSVDATKFYSSLIRWRSLALSA